LPDYEQSITPMATTVLTNTAEREAPAGPVSFDAFLEWMDEDTHAELVDGEIVMASPTSVEHQDIRDFLLGIMGLYLVVHPLGKLLSAPFIIRIPSHLNGREPDILFVKSEHLSRLKPTFLDGPADLVVEITSPESYARDRGAKFVEYEASGIPEYWLIDPLRQVAEFYHLDPDGRYRSAALDTDGRYFSGVLDGFWLKPDWLWQRPLPDISWAAAHIGGAPYARAILETLRASLGDDLLRRLLDENESPSNRKDRP